MEKMTKEMLQQLENAATERRESIRKSKDDCHISGTAYYVSADGDDTADGLHPTRAWKTLDRVNAAPMQPGDGVLFCRGDVFRGGIDAKAGVTYAAYGVGEKPRLYGWSRDLADPSLWEIADAEQHIWKYTEPILDAGTLVMNGGEAWCRKLIPSYIQGRFVCREDETEFAKKEAEEISKLRKIVNGGKNRLVSAKNGFLAIDFDTDLVAIHDVARCMITPEMITNVVKDAIKFGAASASSLVVDTVKRIDDEGFIVRTENRSELRLAGTPQIFCKESYGRAILSADEDDLTLTDDNSLMERVGTRIFLTDVGATNIKITRAEDIPYCEYLIERGEK